MELAGRERELEEAAGALEDVRGGRSRVLGAIGEAGIGKTALLAAIAERAAERRLLVLEGRGVEHEREVPFGLAVDLLHEHVAALGRSRVEALGHDLGAVLPTAEALAGSPVPAGAAPEQRLRSHRALRALLDVLGRERPLVLLLDDLHWADDASLELVLHLLRRPPVVPHLLVFAARPNGAAARLVDAARHASGFAELGLQPLGDDASLDLLADVRDPAVRRRVAHDAGGNPLFLRELARAAGRSAALPRTLTAAIGSELLGLPARSRTLLDGAAVAGDRFDPELAAAAAGLEFDPFALDELVAADLVRATGHGREFGFRHPLVQRAVYDATPPAWRLVAHERAAAALEQHRVPPAARAYHVARFARPGDEAAIALMTQAAAAAAATAPASAAHWYQHALRLLPHDARARAELAAPMALALVTAGRLPAGRVALIEALELLGPEPTERHLELAIACAQVEAQLGYHGEARRRLLAVFEHAPPRGRAVAAFELATTAMMHNELAELRVWAENAARAADGDPLLMAGADALRALAAQLTGGADAGSAGGWLDRAVARLRELDDAALAAHVNVPLHVGRAQLRLQRFADASETFERALAVSLASHQEQMLVHLRAVRAIARWLLLDLDGALAEIEAAEEGARLNGSPQQLLIALWLRTMAHHHRGEADAAERAAEEFTALARTRPASALTFNAACNVASIHVDRDPERAIRAMLDAAGSELQHADHYWGCSLLLALVRAAIAAGRLDEAERWATEASTRDCGLALPASDVRATCARAEVLLARGDARAAAAVAGAAVVDAERIGATMDAADARLLAGRAFAAAGETERAKHALQQVAADAGRGGALRLRDAARRELRRLGTRVSAESQRGTAHGGMTERERGIAELVAHGNSNKQVASALFLSEKTVQNTLTRVYAKLGVRSRTQLTRALTRA